MSVRADGDAESTREAEVCQLEAALFVDQQVLGLQVPVQHAMGVAVCNTGHQLVKVRLQQWTEPSGEARDCTSQDTGPTLISIL